MAFCMYNYLIRANTLVCVVFFLIFSLLVAHCPNDCLESIRNSLNFRIKERSYRYGQKKSFVIAPIGEPNSETRQRSDLILKYLISPAVEECGFEALRADQIDEPGIITRQVIQHIVDDPLVVADLTERNPNVFYELAIRHAIRKPFIHLIQKGEQIPFDVAGNRTIQVDHHDLDSVAKAREEIVRQVKSITSASAEIDSPISAALNTQILRQSENPVNSLIVDLIEMVSGLRSEMNTKFVLLEGLERFLDHSDTNKKSDDPVDLKIKQLREEKDRLMREAGTRGSVAYSSEFQQSVQKIDQEMNQLSSKRKLHI